MEYGAQGQVIPLVAPTITKHDRGYLYDRIDAGLLEDESEVRRFEEAFAERVGCAGAVAVCSGTVALELALEVLGHGVVIIPTYACQALRTASWHGEASYVDSSFDVRTAQMSQDAGDVLVHMFGRPTRRPLVGFSVEDWTLSLGADLILGAPLGVCSTHASKMISTGRGGVVFGSIGWLLERVRELREARSVGMSSTQAALGVSQFQQLDAFIARRRDDAARYTERFRAAGIDCPDADCGSVFFRYLIGVDDPAAKVAALAERGIEAGRGVYPPLHRLAGLPDEQFPGATESVNRLLSVPVHPSITDEQAAYIAEQVVRVCGR